jgi:biopolymer transport protein ExbD
MRVPSHHPPTGVDFNMTPMIDVVFLLIIFFLVSSHLASQELPVELNLPVATTGHDRSAAQAAQITVSVLRDGRILLAGAVVGAEQLGRRLAFESERTGRGLEIRVRSDRDAAYRFVEPVLVACARAGLWNINLAVIRRADSVQ